MKKTLLALLLSVAMVVTYAASAIPFVLAVEGEETSTVPDDSGFGKYQGTYLNLDFDSVDDLNEAVGQNGVNGGFQNTVEDGALKVWATSGYEGGNSKVTFDIPVSGVKVDTTKAFTLSMRLKLPQYAEAGFWYSSDFVASVDGVTTDHAWGQLAKNTGNGKDRITFAQKWAYGIDLNTNLFDGQYHTYDILYTPSADVEGGFVVTLYVDGNYINVGNDIRNAVLNGQRFNEEISEITLALGSATGFTYDEEKPFAFELDYFRIGDAAAVFGKYAGTYFDLSFGDTATTALEKLTLANNSTPQMNVADGYATVTGAGANAQVLYTPSGITVDPTQPISISYRYKVVGTAPTTVEFMFPGSTFITYGNNVNSVVSGLHDGWPAFGYTGKYLTTNTHPGMPNMLDGEFHTVDILYTPIVDEDETNNNKRNAQLYIDGQLIFDTAVAPQDEELDVYAEIRRTVADMSFADAPVTLSNVAIMHRNLTSEQTVVYDYVRLGNGTDFHICSHNLTEHPYKDSNCTETGNELYYECTCGLLYNEATAETTTTLEEKTIAAKGHTESEDWTTDVNGHWHNCTVCGKPATASEVHADTDSDNVCDTCNADITYVYKAWINATDITTVEEVTSVTRGEKVYITVTIGGNSEEGSNVYSAGELVFNFDSEYLTFVKNESTLNGADAEVNGNVLKLADYGDKHDLTDEGVLVYTLVFETTSEADTQPTANVTLVEARFNTEASAKEENLILAKFGTASVDVTIDKPVYAVTLGENLFAEDEEITEGEDLPFELTGDYLANYPNYNVTITVSPEENATLVDNGDGTYTLQDVMGEVSVSMTATPKNYTLTGSVTDNVGTEDNKETLADVLVGSTSFPAELTYGTDFTFSVKADLASTTEPGYYYTVTVRIGDGEWTKWNPTSTADDGINTYTISGSDIKGDVVIVITKQVDAVDYLSLSITGQDVYVKPGQDATQIAPGGSITIVFNPKDGYNYTVTYSSGEVENETLTFDANKEYTFTNVTDNIQVNVTKVVDVDVTVHEYITVDGWQMYLILATNTGETKMNAFAGSTYTYNGVDMYWSDKYGAYCYLIITDGVAPVEDDVKELIAVNGSNAALAISYEMDVNKSGKVDANDAQLTWNMYNALYDNFDTVSMEKFLRADVDATIGVKTEDSVAIINYIIGA